MQKISTLKEYLISSAETYNKRGCLLEVTWQDGSIEKFAYDGASGEGDWMSVYTINEYATKADYICINLGLAKSIFVQSDHFTR